jgi:hypothetical protein
MGGDSQSGRGRVMSNYPENSKCTVLGLEADFRRELYAYEEQRRMPYVTTVEQAGIEKGLQQGEARTLLRLLDRKFGPEAAQRHRERIETAEVEQLDAWLDRILTADTPETIFH